MTSIRGRPSSDAGTTCRSMTRRDASSHTGVTPISASTSAMSSPAVRIAEVPQTDRPTDCGIVAGVGAVAVDQRIGHRLAGVVGQPGRHRLRVDGVEVPAGGQHVDQPAQRRTRRAGRDEAAVQRVQHRGQLVAGAGQPRHDLVGGELQDPPTRRIRLSQLRFHHAGHRRRPPSRASSAACTSARACASMRPRRPGRRPSFRPSADRSPGSAFDLTAPDLRGPQHRQHQVHPGLTDRGLAENVQPVADLGVLDLAQPAVDVQDEVVELGVMRAVGQAQVVVHLGGLDQRPDLRPDRRQLGRVHRRDHRVLVEKLLQLGDVAVRLGPGHRRDQVIDDGGVRPALGLGALAGVVDQERVDQRHRPDARRRCRRHADMPTFLPGSHSRLPCLPRCTTACAPNSSSSHR